MAWSHSRVGTAQRSHRVCDHLKQPRRQRGECRSELRATIGHGIGWPTPLAREHHGHEHLEPLHTSADYIDCGLCYGLSPVRDRVLTYNKVCRCGDSCAGSTR